VRRRQLLAAGVQHTPQPNEFQPPWNAVRYRGLLPLASQLLDASLGMSRRLRRTCDEFELVTVPASLELDLDGRGSLSSASRSVPDWVRSAVRIEEQECVLGQRVDLGGWQAGSWTLRG